MSPKTLVVLVGVVALALAACGGGKQSTVEGKLIDGNGKPLVGVKITASMLQPIKGYDKLEGVTTSDGSFRLRGLFPSSHYELRLGTCATGVQFDSAPQGETAVLPMSAIEELFLRLESPAIGNLRTICGAEVVYHSALQRYATTIAELTHPASGPPFLEGSWTGDKDGYTFTIGGTKDDFTVTADPTTPGVTGNRYFFVDSSGTIRWSTHGPAKSTDPAID